MPSIFSKKSNGKAAVSSSSNPSSSKELKQAKPHSRTVPETHAASSTQKELPSSYARMPTLVAGIGDMRRTMIEGMVTPSQYAKMAHLKTMVPNAQAASDYSEGPPSSFPGRPPPTSSSSHRPLKDQPPSSGNIPKSDPPQRSRTPPPNTPHSNTRSPSAYSQNSRPPPPRSFGSAPITMISSNIATTPTSRQSPTDIGAIGNMRRTKTEGHITTSQFISPSFTSARTLFPPAKPPISTFGPITTTSVHATPSALRMASQQLHITTLPTHERAKQESWAQATIKTLFSSTCPEGNKFTRVDHPASGASGYQCSGGRHFLSDALIASGIKGAIYFLPDPTDFSYRSGPYYPSTSDPTTLLYSGKLPKTQPQAPDWLCGYSKGSFEADGRTKCPIMVGRTVLGRASDRDILNIAEVLGVTGLSADEARRKCWDFVGRGN